MSNFLFAVVLLTSPLSPLAAQDQKALDLLKEATAYIESERGSGTAFCISEEGHFLTCAHVLEGLDDGGEVSLSIQPGQPDEKTVKAQVIRIDRDLDLALLQGPVGAVPALPMGKSSSLRETDPVVAAGFPLGTYLSAGKGAPAVTITSGKVTSLRRKGNLIKNVQIDAELIPGNSGGPVINQKGEVIGVAVATIFGTGLNFAIGTKYAEILVASPRFQQFPLEPIPFAARHEPVTIKVRLDFLRKPGSEPKVKGWFVGTASGEREIEVKRTADSTYELSGIPVVMDQLGSAAMLRAEFVRESGTIRHTQTLPVLDGELKVGGKAVPLSKISLIVPSRGVVRGTDGVELEGQIEGLDAFQQFTNGRVYPFSGSGYDVILLRPASVKQEEVSCRFEVVGEEYTRNLRFPLPIEEGAVNIVSFGDPSIPAYNPSTVSGEIFGDDQIELKLRGEIYDVSWGGGGRYLVAHLRNERLLEIVDCFKGESIGTIPVEDDSLVFGAGAHELLIASKNLVTRWKLDPVERIGEPGRWTSGQILGLSVGVGATQSVGVFYDAIEGAGLFRFELREMQTGRLIAIEPLSSNLKKGMHFSASMDGLVHGGFYSQASYSSGSLFYPSGKVMKRDEVSDCGWVCPGVDGKLFYTSGGMVGLQGYPGSKVADWPLSVLIPTTVRGVACRLPQPPGLGARSSTPSPLPHLDIVDARSGRELRSKWVYLEELDPAKMVVEFKFTKEDPLTWNKRCMYSPQLGLLATIPLAGRSVMVRKLDLWKALREAGEEFLHVTGTAPRHVKAGSILKAALTAESSSAQPLKFELLSGPEGMEISAEGAVTWEIPSTAAGSVVRILVRLSSEEGLERLWIHDLAVH